MPHETFGIVCRTSDWNVARIVPWIWDYLGDFKVPGMELIELDRRGGLDLVGASRGRKPTSREPRRN